MTNIFAWMLWFNMWIDTFCMFNKSVPVINHEFNGWKTRQNAVEKSICYCTMTHTEFQICIEIPNLNEIRT